MRSDLLEYLNLLEMPIGATKNAEL